MLKKLNTTLLLLFSILGMAANTITISGKILNHSEGFLVFYGQKYNIELELDKNGEFRKEVNLKYTGIYNAEFNKKPFKVYLSANNNIILKADAKNFENTLVFEGNNALQNNYLKRKEDVFNRIIGSEEAFYKLDEKTFLEKLQLWKTEILSLYKSINFQDTYFETHEIKNIDYTESYFLNIYNGFHLTDDRKPTVSANFPSNKIGKNLNFDNVEDYLFSETYLVMIDCEYYNRIEKLVKNNPLDESKIEIEEYKKLKNEYLGNKILNNFGYKISPSNLDLEYFYNELMTLIKNENWKNDITKKYLQVKKLTKGTPSPTFNFENFNGGFTSLESLKGKYIYIDVWATWCGPCQNEIPFLQKLENIYASKNIEFVSISLDRKKDYNTWRKMVSEKKLGGTQLFANESWKTQFVKDYVINSIPRFILLDPEGNIVNADAPRPSDPKLIELFNETGIN